MPLLGLSLTGGRHGADADEEADDAGQVIDILAMALGTFENIMLRDMSAVIADGIGNVVSEVTASLLDRHLKELSILLLREVFLEIHVQSGAAIQTIGESVAVELELIQYVQAIIFYFIEVGVVAITRNKVSVALIPCGVLDTKAFCQSVTFMTSHCLFFE